jgi:hypothetical protein
MMPVLPLRLVAIDLNRSDSLINDNDCSRRTGSATRGVRSSKTVQSLQRIIVPPSPQRFPRRPPLNLDNNEPLSPRQAAPRSASTSAPRTEPDTRTRRLLDSHGREWRVREAPPSPYDRRAACCLIFETVDMARRVRDYPPNWADRGDAFLLELCEHPAARRSDDCE